LLLVSILHLQFHVPLFHIVKCVKEIPHVFGT
jgi:hypothetical protein